MPRLKRLVLQANGKGTLSTTSLRIAGIIRPSVQGTYTVELGKLFDWTFNVEQICEWRPDAQLDEAAGTSIKFFLTTITPRVATWSHSLCFKLYTCMSDGHEVQPCTQALCALTLQDAAKTDVYEEEVARYDPGDSNVCIVLPFQHSNGAYSTVLIQPYTHEYIFKHEPFRYLPDPYYPDDGFTPPTLVFGIGLLRHEAIAYAEEHGILVPSDDGSKYIAPQLFRGYRGMASHFSKLYGRRINAVTVLSRKCDIVFAIFDSYSRPEDVETRLEMRDIFRELIEIFPGAIERQGYFYWAMNESMYPPGYVARRYLMPSDFADTCQLRYSRLMYKQT